MVHKCLHLTQPKHRSWQTHSLLVSGGILLLIYMFVTYGSQLWAEPSSVDWVIAKILAYGFILGYSSHLFLDAINPSGIHLIPGMKIKFVPRSSFFATSGTWETRIIYPLCLIVSAVSAIITVAGVCGIDLISLLLSLNKG